MRIQLVNNIAIVTSNITKEEFDAARTHAPETLIVAEEGEQLFKVGFNEECGDISKYGVTFNTVTDAGYLAVSDLIPNLGDRQDKVDYLKENNGIAITRLANFEMTIKEQITSVTDAVNEVFAELEGRDAE